MAGQIRIDPGTMRSRASEYNHQGEQINDIIRNMDNLLNQLQSEWEGSASEAYANRYTSELRPNFQKAVQLAQEIAEALNKAADEMEQRDADIARSFQG